MPIQLRLTLTFEDYVDAQRLHAKRGWWPRLNLVLAYTLVPLMGLCFLLIAVLIGRNGDAWTLFVIELVAGLFLAGYPLFVRMRWKRCYVRTLGEQGESTVQLDDKLIKTRAATMRSEIQWAAVRSFSENDKVFLLYLAPARFLLLPKRVCSEQQV